VSPSCSNQQKAVQAMWLARRPGLITVDELARGSQRMPGIYHATHERRKRQ
jgi:hypothetical protein